MKAVLCVCLSVLLCQQVLAVRLRELKMREKEPRGSQTLTLSMEEARHKVRLCFNTFSPSKVGSYCVIEEVNLCCVLD